MPSSGATARASRAVTAEEQARLDAIVKGAIAKGIVWGNTADPRWNSYDDGPDPVTWLKEVLPVRDSLLAHYSPRMLRPGEPNSMFTSRLPLVYLFHRYALGAAINVVGSAKVPLSLAGDGQQPIIIWPAESQKEALQLALSALNPSRSERFAGNLEGAGATGKSRFGCGAVHVIGRISFQPAGRRSRRV